MNSFYVPAAYVGWEHSSPLGPQDTPSWASPSVAMVTQSQDIIVQPPAPQLPQITAVGEVDNILFLNGTTDNSGETTNPHRKVALYWNANDIWYDHGTVTAWYINDVAQTFDSSGAYPTLSTPLPYTQYWDTDTSIYTFAPASDRPTKIRMEAGPDVGYIEFQNIPRLDSITVSGNAINFTGEYLDLITSNVVLGYTNPSTGGQASVAATSKTITANSGSATFTSIPTTKDKYLLQMSSPLQSSLTNRKIYTYGYFTTGGST